MSDALGNNGGRYYSFGVRPVAISCSFVVNSANANGLGVQSLTGQGVKNVYMYTSQTPMKGVGNTILNPMGQTASKGYALVQLRSNYAGFLGSDQTIASPVTGSALAINSTNLVVGTPYQIASVGAGPAGVVTIAPVADVAGSLAGTYFMLYDGYGNSYCVWFNVSGLGSQPNLGPAVMVPPQRGLQYVQVSIASGSSAATVGAAIVTAISNLPSGVQGTNSFTASGTTTITVTSTVIGPIGIPQDGNATIPSQGPAVPIIFTIASASASAGAVYTDGLGHLYTVSATISAATTLKTTGVGQPNNGSAGILSLVSGTGAATISFTTAVAGFATGFSFARTIFDTNLGDWQAIGLMPGLTPTVGQSFVAKATGAGNSTGTVQAIGSSGIQAIEVMGLPGMELAPQPQGGTAYTGSWFMLQFLGSTSTSVTSLIPTAPANGSTVNLRFYLDASHSPSNGY